VVLVIAEITEQLAKEREELAQDELLQGIRQLLRDRAGFQVFLRETGDAVDEICDRKLDADPVLLMRELHTLKGDTGSMGFSLMAALCHGLEQELSASGATSDEALGGLRRRWASITEHLASFVGHGESCAVEIPEADFATLLARLSAEGVTGDLLQQFQDFQLDPIDKPLARLGEQARGLARRLGKGDIHVDVQANAVRVDIEIMGPLLSQLVHLVRNAVDHGLEAPEEREASGKPARGTLVLRALASAEVLTLEIEDDGRGIDWDAIARRAREAGLAWQTHRDLVDVLCSDGVTTRSEVTHVSGRGVGMAAVRQRVEQLNGCIEIQSVRGAGTKVGLRLPWNSPVGSLSPGRRARSRRSVPVSS
jgi:chemotaxis protein histidine kinase CheA